ncbi:MAG TPA: hypothetical protein PK691_07770 [Thermomicrobiales bacterium]|nr:hypothetical protein [Thermomicrobiales bacterium]HRA47990.1 hypothetical protein [Thermomicrobiales bacterium]
MASNAEAVRELWAHFAAGEYRRALPLLAPSFRARWVVTREILPTPEAFIRVQEEYPGSGRIRLDRLIDDGETIVTIALVDWAGEAHFETVSEWTFTDDGLIAGVTEWWPDESEPPAGREHLTERY